MNDRQYIGVRGSNEIIIAVCKDSYVVLPVVLTETENENDSANQNYVAKMT